MEGGTGSGVAAHQDLAFQRAIEKFPAIARPLWKDTTTGGNLPLVARASEGSDGHNVATRFAALIGQPAAIRRKGGLHFGGRTVYERLGLPGPPAGLLVALDWKGHDVQIRAGIGLSERQN